MWPPLAMKSAALSRCTGMMGAVPTMHAEVENNTPILLCESVIIGNVPETFLQGGLLLGVS